MTKPLHVKGASEFILSVNVNIFIEYFPKCFVSFISKKILQIIDGYVGGLPMFHG